MGLEGRWRRTRGRRLAGHSEEGRAVGVWLSASSFVFGTWCAADMVSLVDLSLIDFVKSWKRNDDVRSEKTKINLPTSYGS